MHGRHGVILYYVVCVLVFVEVKFVVFVCVCVSVSVCVGISVFISAAPIFVFLLVFLERGDEGVYIFWLVPSVCGGVVFIFVAGLIATVFY